MMLEPVGELFSHVQPSNMSGLTSEGWDRMHYQGCFQLIDVNFWHDEVVQNFLQLVLKTGSDMEQRWQEQVNDAIDRLFYILYLHFDVMVINIYRRFKTWFAYYLYQKKT